MLRQTRRKRHLISSPPPKMPFFGEGGKDFGAQPIFWNNYRPIPATSGHLFDFGKLKKSGIFSIFGQIWQLFF